jgi:hypothetical protein
VLTVVLHGFTEGLTEGLLEVTGLAEVEGFVDVEGAGEVTACVAVVGVIVFVIQELDPSQTNEGMTDSAG